MEARMREFGLVLRAPSHTLRSSFWKASPELLSQIDLTTRLWGRFLRIMEIASTALMKKA